MRTIRHIAFLLAMLAVVTAACSGAPAASSPGPSGSPPPAPSADGGPITTPQEAIAAVVRHEPSFAGISERDPNLIGQADWYEVTQASGVGVFIVTIRMGWGDCPAGCIDEHVWTSAIGPNGEVTLQAERGSDLPPGIGPRASDDAGRTGLRINAVAGPVCPVERIPPDPACAPRAVGGATIAIRDPQGVEIKRISLDATGSAFVELPPGDYEVVGGEVEGLMGVPEPQVAAVTDGVATTVDLTYDTGIR
ncbi:MAG: hypothetical protein ACTS8Z_09785 [Candidatus Limnocylindrales bacterium]